MRRCNVNKPTLLYASPFAPKESGISDYSVILVNALRELFDITLFIDNYDITEPSIKDLPVLKDGVDEIDLNSFDHVIYNMGNNAEYHDYIYKAALKRPGAVILHDLSICDFINAHAVKNNLPFFTYIYETFGLDAFTVFKETRKDGNYGKDIVSKMFLNDELLKSGNKIIVHSEYSKDKILKTGLISEDKVCKINMIEQIATGETFIAREELVSKFNIPADAVLVCAFGFVSDTKFNVETARAVKEINQTSDKKLCYVMVGAGNYADAELKEGEVMKTGFTTIEEFNSLVNCADIIVNLRYQPLGETSGSMLRILQLGKACITNNGGWFTEIPDDCVMKISVENVEAELKDALLKLSSDKSLADKIGNTAKENIAKYHGKQVIAREFYDFLTKE